MPEPDLLPGSGRRAYEITMSIEEQLELAQTTIAVLCAVLVLLCCYIVRPEAFTVRSDQPEAICPLHRVARNTCDRYHKEDS